MKNRNNRIVKVGVTLCTFAATGVLTASAAEMMPSKDDVMKMMQGWPADSAKYGVPDEATASMMVWHNNGVFKRTVASRTSITHKFPVMHPDSMEQFVDYKSAARQVR
jgi:hypothetical protein